MHFPVRLFLSAALFALASTTAVRAQDSGIPLDLLDDTDAFGSLRGSDSLASVDLTLPTETPGTGSNEPPPAGRAVRSERVAPVIAEEDEPARPRNRTAGALDDSAYDPLGIRLGGFILLPSIELRGGYTSNAAGASTGGPSGVLSVLPDVTLRSDWSRHEVNFRYRSSNDFYTDGSVAEKPTVQAEANARIDLPRDWALRLRAGYDYETQSLSSLDYPTGVENPPGVNTYAAGATLDGTLGRAVLQFRSNVVATEYEDGKAGDVTIPQGDRDNTWVSGATRLGYQVTPVLTPFVEAEISDRSFRQKIDSNGFNRASQGVTLRGGIAYSADPVLKGELAIGWHHERYDDTAFQPLNAMTIDGNVLWAPTELTKFTLRAATYVEPTTDPNSAGSIVYDVGLKAEHALRRNVTLEADLGWQYQPYQGIDVADTTYEAGFGVTWKINRSAWVVGRLSQEYYQSAQPGGSYPTTTATVGLRVQR